MVPLLLVLLLALPILSAYGIVYHGGPLFPLVAAGAFLPFLVLPAVVGVEHADAQGESAPAVFSVTGRWVDVRDHRDLADRPRFVTARLAR